MKILKYLLFIFLILLIGSSVYFGTKDGKFDISENKIISAPPQVIFNIVMDFKSWQNWGPWMVNDPEIKISYSGQTDGINASSSWTSENQKIGSGSIENIKAIEPKELQQQIIFKTKLGDTKNDVYWYFEPGEVSNQTKVVWGMKGAQTFMEKVSVWFNKEDRQEGLRKMLGDGLSNLETVVIQEMDKYSIIIDGLTNYDGGSYMYITATATKKEVHNKFTSNLNLLSNYMLKNNIPIAGPPFIIYGEVNQTGDIIFSTCLRTSEKIELLVDDAVQTAELIPLTALKVSIIGNRNHLSEVYTKADEYIRMNKLIKDSTAQTFEVYVSDAAKTLNLTKLITEIYIPIKPKLDIENEE